MLVPFVIDADSLDPDRGWTPATTRTCYGSFLDTWERFGLLVHDSELFEQSALYRSLTTARLPVKIKSLWQELLARNPPIACKTAWCGTITKDAIGAGFPNAATAFIDDTRAVVDFAFDDDEDERSVTTVSGRSLDICRLHTARHAARFQHAQDMAGKHIAGKETWQEIWDSRFAGLAAAPIKHVSIVDRYAAEQHHTCPQAQLSGLSRFLKQLSGAGDVKRSITVFSAWTDKLVGQTLADVKREVSESIQKLDLATIQRLTLWMLPNAVFGDLAHDRFIRFSSSYVWDIGIGLEIFQGPRAGKTSAATFKSGLAISEYADIEDRLRAEPRAKEIRVVG